MGEANIPMQRVQERVQSSHNVNNFLDVTVQFPKGSLSFRHLVDNNDQVPSISRLLGPKEHAFFKPSNTAELLISMARLVEFH